MPRVHFGTKSEPGYDLEESRDLIVVRTRSRRSVLWRGPVPLPTAADLADGERVASFEDAGVEVFRVPGKARSVESRKLSLRQAPDVRFAGSVLVNKSGEPVLYTENLYLRFHDAFEVDCEAVIRDAGLTIKRRLEFASNAFFVEAPEGIGQEVFDLANRLLKRSDVLYCHPELVQFRARKQIFPQQWHLKDATIGTITVKAHANVAAAHAITEGAGVTIAVIDDGCDIDHREFSTSGKIVAPYDANLQTDNPRPRPGNDHGTACSGVACAAGIDGASGVAPAARLMPIRLDAGLGSLQEAEAFKWAADHGADVISCSWGPLDGAWWDPTDKLHAEYVPLPASTRDAIDYCVAEGRGGKGCVIVFAAGNGNETVDSDGYASYQKVIAVAACNDRGKRSVYSDIGHAVWCSFPSNDIGHLPFNHPEPLTTGIWTTDVSGTAGFNLGDSGKGDVSGNFRNEFGGTSSAAPGAAGIAALVIAANKELRWSEVKDILKRSCDKIDPVNGEYDADGHSRFYGYGRLNAEEAVKLAQSSISVVSTTEKRINLPIPDLGQVEATLEIGTTTPVESLTFLLKVEHPNIGDLVITLVPPPGRGFGEVVLHQRSGGSLRNIDRLYDASNIPALSQFAGKRCHGVWAVRVEDRDAQDAGVLVQIGLQLSLPSITSAAAPAPSRMPLAPRALTGRPRPASKGKGRASKKKLTKSADRSSKPRKSRSRS